jgi:hypothetical protein
MTRGKRAGRWGAAVVGTCLFLFLAAGRLHLIRADALALAACPLELAGEALDEDAVIRKHRDAVLAAARRHDLPPEVLAAIIRGHQRGLTPIRRFTDCAGSALGADLSLGLAQIRVSTAVSRDKLKADPVSPANFERYRTALLDPDTNIEYEARELRQLLDRKIRFPGIASEDLVRDPFAMALLMSEYRAGPENRDAKDSRIGMTGLRDLREMLADGVYVFGRDEAEMALIQDQVFRYLDETYCHGARVLRWHCDDWRASAAYRAGRSHSLGRPRTWMREASMVSSCGWKKTVGGAPAKPRNSLIMWA